MPNQNTTDFSLRLLELNKWQIEQQRKLKEFQETQKRLLSTKYNIFRSNAQNFALKDKTLQQYPPSIELNHDILKLQNNCSDGTTLKLATKPKTDNNDEIVNLPYKSFVSASSNNESNNSGNWTLKGPRQFLKRGDGLARFRMTLDDFKNPPKIYKEKTIKTYLNKKPENRLKNTIHSKTPSAAKDTQVKLAKIKPKAQCRNKKPIAVNIYVPETKPIRAKQPVSCAPTQSVTGCINKASNVLNLGSISESATLKLPLKNKPGNERIDENASHFCGMEAAKPTEFEKKNTDERELKLFEILEEKVNESSFCSTSSLIDRLMEQSISPTPAKFSNMNWKGSDPKPSNPKSHNADNCSEQNPNGEIRCNEPQILPSVIHSITNNPENETEVVKAFGEDEEEEELMFDMKTGNNRGEFEESHYENISNTWNSDEDDVMPFNENETLKNHFRNDKQRLKPVNQNEIAVTVQRKGLQDNVKQLMNWENSPRKVSSKRIVKKIKTKSKKNEKTKLAGKEQTEKVTINSTLLRNRLEELEKEIMAFRKENSRMEKLEKDLNEERIKLAKERKDFEKQMQEEKDMFEMKMSEGKKKLQKERTVFETYCKQASNRPNRQEREEIVQLKKENEKLKESMATKEARWGASQARLRNQVRNLEKENSQLKTENERLKKLTSKKVTFGNDQRMNSRIIRAINFELGRLRTTVTAEPNESGCACKMNQSRNTGQDAMEKSLRQIRTIPNAGKSPPCERYDEDEDFLEPEDKMLSSTSTDSGIDTNRSKQSLPAVSDRVEKSRDTRQTSDRAAVVAYEDENEDEPKENGDSEDEEVEDRCRAILGFGNRKSTRSWSDDPDDCIALSSVVRESVFGTKDVERRKMWKPKDCCPSLDKSSSQSEFDWNEDELKRRYFPANEDDYALPRATYRQDSYPHENSVEEKTLKDGTKEMIYPNGNIKRISPDNKIVKILYYNGDIKETNKEDESEKYYYSETKTWHTTYRDGMEVIEFPSGQTERRYANGSSEISFPNGCVRYCDPLGRDEWRFADGTVLKTNELGHRILLMTNGQKEVHTDEFKKREYPNGTVKILYTNGTQETRYASGRVRLKDKDGHLVMDSGGL